VFQPIRLLTDALPERFREGLGRRAVGFAAALLLEGLLLLLLLTLGRSPEPEKKPLITLTSFDARSEPEHPPPQPETRPDTHRLTQPVPHPPQPVTPTPPQPAPTPPPMIVLPRDQANFSLANLAQNPAPPAKAAPAYGPADTGSVGDSQRVGTAPDGSPLYGAAWYRRPTNVELAAFGSRAQNFGSAWGRIACKTAPDFRVEDCVIVDEYPENSHLANAVLSAAWQFKVRPPWKGGHAMIGSWVQITIYNDTDDKPKYGK
jgi:protein TonB